MMIKCTRCGIAYSHSRSTSALVLTYCCMLCEVADLGFSLAAFEKAPVAELRAAEHPNTNRHDWAGAGDWLAA